MTIRSFMQTTIIAGAAGLMLLAGGALSQTAPQQNQAPNQPVATPPAPTAPTRPLAAPDPMKMEDVSRIRGAIVYGSDNKKIGSVSTILMNPASLTLDRLVVSDGGILGVGSHLVAMPIEEFAWDPQSAGFRVAVTADELKRMPEWKEQLSQLPPPDAPARPAPPKAPAPAAGGTKPAAPPSN